MTLTVAGGGSGGACGGACALVRGDAIRFDGFKVGWFDDVEPLLEPGTLRAAVLGIPDPLAPCRGFSGRPSRGVSGGAVPRVAAVTVPFS